MDIGRDEVRPRTLGEAAPSFYPLGKAKPSPRGSGEAKSIPRGSGEAESSPEPSGEAEPSPQPSGEVEPSGEAELAHGRWARRNQTPVFRARSDVVLLSVWEFLKFDGY